MRPTGIATTQITFLGGERIGVVQSLDEAVQALTRPEAKLVSLTREDGAAIHVNPAHVLYVRTVM